MLGRGLAGHKHYQGPEEGEYGEIALPAGYALHVINAAGAEEGICDIGCGGVDIVAYEGGIGAAGLGGLEGIKQQLCAAAPGNAYEHIVHSKAGGQHIHHHGIGYRCGVVAHVVELVGNVPRKKLAAGGAEYEYALCPYGLFGKEARNIFSITASSLSVGRIGSLLRDSMEEEPLARATRKSKKPL